MADETTASVKAIGNDKTLELALNNVRQSLRDPDGAKFRNTRVQQHGISDKLIVCGEVNGKNSYGGYVGFVKFIASPTSHYIYDTYSRPEIADASNAGMRRTCYHG